MKRRVIFLALAFVMVFLCIGQAIAAEKPALESTAQRFSYKANINGNRISKTVDGELHTFTYGEQSTLLTETRGSKVIEYLYETFDYGRITGFLYNGERYSYGKDDDFNVISIFDSKGDEVSRYEYDADGLVSSVYGKDESGEWVDASDNKEFIGYVNKIRLHSFYFDEETGWYYDGRNYYDSAKNEFVGKPYNSDEISTYEGFQAYLEQTGSPVIMPLMTPLAIKMWEIDQWKTSLMNSDGFGKPIEYKANWYSSLSDVELIARLFYGESGIDSTMKDSNAVFWVFKNIATNDGLTNRENATKSGRFSSIVAASSSETNAARNPSTNSTLWDNAVKMACSLLISGANQYWEDLVPCPTGISGQLNFRSLNWAKNSSNARDYNSKLQFNVNGTWKNVKNVVVVSQSSYITSYTTLSGLSNPANCTYNVYFDWE